MSRYHTIEAGTTGVTIIVEDRTLWIAATVAGKCRSAIGLYHGPQRSILTGEDLDTPRHWRPLFWRCRTTGPVKHGDYIHSWWPWLHLIVNPVRMGYIHDGTSRKWPNHAKRSPRLVAEQLAEQIRQHLEATYRYG